MSKIITGSIVRKRWGGADRDANVMYAVDGKRKKKERIPSRYAPLEKLDIPLSHFVHMYKIFKAETSR